MYAIEQNRSRGEWLGRMRFAVLMKGVLRGMGHQTPCELLATKTVVPEATRPVYSHCAIIESPPNLPDGDYEVEFSGEVAITRLQDGYWLVGRVMPSTYAEAASFFARQARRMESTARKPTGRPGEGLPAMSLSRRPRQDP